MSAAPKLRSLLQSVMGRAGPVTDARVTDLASATELIQEISKGSATSVLREVKLALSDLNGLDWVNQKERLRTTLYLDERAYRFVKEVISALLVKSSDPLFVSRALPLLVDMWQQLGNSYRKWLEAADASHIATPEGQLALCRLMALQVRMAECLLLRAKPVHPQIWSLAHKLHQMGARGGLAAVHLYPDDPVNTSPSSVLGVLHLLALMPYAQMPPGHVLALADWLWLRQEGVLLTDHASADCTLVVDLATKDAAVPLRRHPPQTLHRYVDCQAVLTELRRRAPPFIGTNPRLHSALDEAWSGRFRVYSRSQSRHTVDAAASVRLGWTPLLALIAKPKEVVQADLQPKALSANDWQPTAPGEEAPKATRPEPAKLMDESAQGALLLIPRGAQTEPQLGDLVGVTGHAKPCGRVGLVVWLDRHHAKYTRLGLRWLGDDAVVVHTQRAGAQRRVEAIALQRGEGADSQWTGVLFQPGTVVAEGQYLVGQHDQPELCRLVPDPLPGWESVALAQALPA